jgi:phage-related baseplate assembly protein
VDRRVLEHVRVLDGFATGADLDQIGANFGLARLQIDAGDATAIPPVPPTMEPDADFRSRIQLSFEGYTTAGSEGSYVFHGLGADGDVKDIQAVSPDPGDVTVYVLSRTGTGTASPELIAKVNTTLSADRIRPLAVDRHKRFLPAHVKLPAIVSRKLVDRKGRPRYADQWRRFNAR